MEYVTFHEEEVEMVIQSFQIYHCNFLSQSGWLKQFVSNTHLVQAEMNLPFCYILLHIYTTI